MSGEDADGPAEVAAGEGPSEVEVRVPDTGPAGYRVEVARGGLDAVGRRCREHTGAERYAVIADERVGEIYGDRALRRIREAGGDPVLLTFPEGESSKSRGIWAELQDRMMARGLGRDSAVVALGGGVTGDLAGFVAASYMRGIPVVQVPTSVLAMVDSSVGGKVGLNTDHGKNLVGAFHHPRHVVADPDVLETLDPRHRTAGLAEAVKAAAIADRTLLEWMEGETRALARGGPDTLERVVGRSVAIKAGVVGRDPEERGERAVLNFGHTVGHGLEAASGYGALHGEAVALGMRLECRLGEALGVTGPGTSDRLDRLLRELGLAGSEGESTLARAGVDEVMAAVARDKKRRRGRIRVVLLAGPGRVARTTDGEYTHVVDTDRLARWLEEALATIRQE